MNILRYEMALMGAPGFDGLGINLLGPTLMMFGSEEQKKEHLVPISKGQRAWCELYSEPQAGSDLSSAQTRAVRKGDHYVLNGQKVWNTGAHRADWGFCLARTNPDAPKKNQGLSFFLIDMKTPGVEVCEIKNLTGRHSFNEVFFEDAKIPGENRVGAENQGWIISNSLLGFERSAIEFIAYARMHLDALLQFAGNTQDGRNLMARNPALRHQLAELDVETDVASLLNSRVSWMQDNDLVADAEAGMAKVFASELLQRISQTGMRLEGLYGSLLPGSPRALLEGCVPDQYMADLSWTIAAGTSEVLRTSIATRGMGFPMR